MLLLAIATTVVQGRVFLRWEGRADVIGNLKRLGGTVAYETEIQINGGDGTLTVIGFDDAMDTALPNVRSILKLPTNATPSSSSTLHFLRGDTSTLRLLLMRFENTGRAIAIAIEQTNAAFEASEKAPHKHLLKAMSAYPGSRPTFYAEDVNTKLRVAISSTTADGDSVRQYYDRELTSKGWTPSFKSQAGLIPEMPLYHRKSELCCVLLTPSQSDQTQRITLLHKELGNTSK